MDVSGLGQNTFSSLSSQDEAFRDADFLQVMLNEITHQDPLEPAETSKIVDNMRKLQELANSRYEKYRQDMAWARDLVGQAISVQQASLGEAEYEELMQRGIQPDRGYLTIEGRVENFKIMGESVWVTIDDKDYPIDNVRRIVPENRPDQYMELANNMIGRKVQYLSDDGTFAEGIVRQLDWNNAGEVFLTMDDDNRVLFNRVLSIAAA